MSSASPGSTTSQTFTSRIENRQWAHVFRFTWVALVVVSVTMFLFSIPAEYQIFRDSPVWGGGFSSALEQLRLSQDFLAVYTTVFDIVVVSLALALAILVFSQRSNDWMALLVSSAVVLYATSLTLAFYLSSPTVATAIRILIPVVIVGIMFVYPDGRFTAGWTKFLLAVLVLVGIVDLFLAATGSGSLLLTSFGYPFGMIALWLRYKHSATSPIQRQQVKWLLWGAIAAFFAYTIYYIVPMLFPSLGSIDSENPVYSPESLITFLILNSLRLSSSMIFVSAVGLSIIRYRLWDIDLTINRSLVYACVTGILGLLFLLVFLAAQAVLGGIFGHEQSGIAIAISAVVTTALFNPTRKRVRNLIDRRLYGFRFDLNELNAAQKLPEIHNPGLLTGRIVGGYQVLGVLGKGGMGEVYQAQRDGQVVAIKILPTDLADRADFRKRFEREANTLAAIDHPNIVKVLASGESAGVYYMALEFVDGRDLSVLIRERGGIPVEDVRVFLRDCAAALDYAHQRGFIHRDIKPSNIRLRLKPDRETEEAVLMDFGIAKIQDAHTELTGTGAVGTIDYMAPEQIMSAAEVDHRADIYALGIVAYEMLTGERPFKGSAAQVMFAHLQQPAPDPRDVKDDIPSAAAHAIRRALSKQPNDRFDTAGQLVEALQLRSL
jgi:hypothetical protein